MVIFFLWYLLYVLSLCIKVVFFFEVCDKGLVCFLLVCWMLEYEML